MRTNIVIRASLAAARLRQNRSAASGLWIWLALMAHALLAAQTGSGERPGRGTLPTAAAERPNSPAASPVVPQSSKAGSSQGRHPARPAVPERVAVPGNPAANIPVTNITAANITVQLPTFGVAIDADGVLAVQAVGDVDGRLHAERVAAARQNLPPRLRAWSKLRKVSLVRLERAIRRQLDAGKPLDEAQQALAGLQQIHYVFCLPDSADVLLAGPAEGWLSDASGRLVGLSTGQPVIELADLAVALRAYQPGRQDRPFVGCTIDPSPAGLARFVEFQKQIPRSVPVDGRAEAAQAITAGMRQSLGLAVVRVFGISPQTHFAQVLVEADYRMKLIGVGLEQPPVPIVTFAGAVGNARQALLERWWFTPNYDCVRIADDGLGMQLLGNGVQLQGEDKTIGPDGQLLAAGHAPNKASELFTASFTRKYPELAARSPVYAQLRNCIDLLVAAAFLERSGAYQRAGWRADTLLSEQAIRTETAATPRHVACVAHAFWNGNRLVAPAGGGVSIVAHQALEPEHLLKDNVQKLAAERGRLQAAVPADAWWWD